MNIFEALRVAFAGLLANRLRSSLTMLGILIGVAAVILLVAVGNGASVQINNQIQGLGANVIFVYPANAKGAGGVSQGFGTSQSLTMADVDAINSRQQDQDVVAAIPIAQSGGQITYAVRGTDGLPHVYLVDTGTRKVVQLTNTAAADPVFLSPGYVWYVGLQLCNPGCGYDNLQLTGKTYIDDLQARTEAQSRITAVFDVWPHGS